MTGIPFALSSYKTGSLEQQASGRHLARWHLVGKLNLWRQALLSLWKNWYDVIKRDKPDRLVDQQCNLIKEISHEGVMNFNNRDKIYRTLTS